MVIFDISLARANEIYTWGWRLSIAGAVITALGVGLLMWGTRVRDHDFESRMTRANSDAATANEIAALARERAATAEQRAAQATLELAKLRAPRALTTEQKSELITQLKALSGQQFQMITYQNNDECSSAFMLIYNALTDAGWVREGPPKGIPIGAMQSILINVNDAATEHTKRAASVLGTFLNDHGIVATLGNNTSNNAIVDILIGLKP